ncbi:YfiR family protein [Hydrogenophaga taeniospiralis]|uniref:YfiR family protein n=1 Tax=Hydrogenophaga taeniospiralis TaxID=65656 RepID=UPI001CFB6F2B|nr:YfiR family protein [Hydrogenophaga taeniospiralis]MCB4363539.1 YfiR family protein [Hydrogenophaga taeniospiralis]
MPTKSMRTVLKLWVIALLWMLHLPGLVASQELALANPNRVKAAFLRNFAHYVGWPADAFPNSSTPWHICVLGPDPFGDILETSLKGRTEQGRSFEVFRAETLDQLPSCQMVFLAYKDDTRRRAVLDKLKNKPVLTVGDAPEFLREGGTIRFEVDDRVRLSINLDQARIAALTIQTRMLEVSSEVLDNGVVRRMR